MRLDLTPEKAAKLAALLAKLDAIKAEPEPVATVQPEAKDRNSIPPPPAPAEPSVPIFAVSTSGGRPSLLELVSTQLRWNEPPRPPEDRPAHQFAEWVEQSRWRPPRF